MEKLQYPKDIALIIENTEREMQILKARVLNKKPEAEIQAQDVALSPLTEEEKKALIK